MGKLWDASRGIFRASGHLSRTARNAIATGTSNAGVRHASRIAGTGVLGPGDPDPPPLAGLDYYDYRGTAAERELKALRGLPYSLGQFLDPHKGPRRDIGLPFEVLLRHAAVVGPTGSGKTKSILIPWIATCLREGHAAIAIDVSGDLFDDLVAYRSQTSPMNAAVGTWDYSKSSSSLSWNWIRGLSSDEAVVAAVDALHGRLNPADAQPFFHQRDARLLRGLIELARDLIPDVTGRDLLSLVRDQARLEGMVMANPRHKGAQRLVDLTGRGGNYAQIISGLINDLEIWDNDGLQAVTSSDSLDLNSLFDNPNLLIVGAPIYGGRISEAASGLMLSQIVNRLFRRFSQSAGEHVFLFIDEAARLENRIDFDELLSLSRRARVSVVLAAQDVGQFPDENQRLAIFGNCATYISLPGRSNANAEYLMGRLGQRYQSSLTLTTQPGPGFGGLGHTNQVGTVPVLGAREIMDPPWGERCGIVHSQPASGRPFLVDLTRPEFSGP
jgi:type IV secretory pathway TraG/TraD family ATPase VirD4